MEQQHCSSASIIACNVMLDCITDLPPGIPAGETCCKKCGLKRHMEAKLGKSGEPSASSQSLPVTLDKDYCVCVYDNRSI